MIIRQGNSYGLTQGIWWNLMKSDGHCNFRGYSQIAMFRQTFRGVFFWEALLKKQECIDHCRSTTRILQKPSCFFELLNSIHIRSKTMLPTAFSQKVLTFKAPCPRQPRCCNCSNKPKNGHVDCPGSNGNKKHLKKIRNVKHIAKVSGNRIW